MKQLSGRDVRTNEHALYVQQVQSRAHTARSCLSRPRTRKSHVACHADSRQVIQFLKDDTDLSHNYLN